MIQTPTPVVSPAVFTLFDAIAFIASIAGLALSGVAIWLALVHKRDADSVYKETAVLLADIRSETKAITQGVMAELKAYGDSMRGTFARNQSAMPESFSASASGIEYRPAASASQSSQIQPSAG